MLRNKVGMQSWARTIKTALTKAVRGECFPFAPSIRPAPLDTATPTRDERIMLCECEWKMYRTIFFT